jgi:hypothetical protein
MEDYMNALPPMTQLDYMVSTNETLMLKAFLPYINSDFASYLAIYIKYSELMSTINLFKNNKNVFKKCESQDFFQDIIGALAPYVPEMDRQTFETLGNMKNIMETFEQYKDLFDGSSAETIFEAFTGRTDNGF